MDYSRDALVFGATACLAASLDSFLLISELIFVNGLLDGVNSINQQTAPIDGEGKLLTR